ncbi:MAG: SPOR domain-containing protein [Bryobacteraceae bacterium]
MARSEDGEFELILGNKQLLSVFFIVVVLLGVFFTMGYIVGKNSVSPEMAGGKPPSGAIVVEPTDPAPKPTAGIVVEPDKPSAFSPPPTKAESVKKEKEKAKEEKKKTEVVTPPPAPPASSKPAVTASGEPASGQTFLQVVASTRPDCEIIVDVLKRKGFSAVMAPGPNPDLFRVLVGPLSDAATISKTRTDLEAAGFQKPYLRKY